MLFCASRASRFSSRLDRLVLAPLGLLELPLPVRGRSGPPRRLLAVASHLRLPLLPPLSLCSHHMSRKALHIEPVLVPGTHGVQVFRFQQAQAPLSTTTVSSSPSPPPSSARQLTDTCTTSHAVLALDRQDGPLQRHQQRRSRGGPHHARRHGPRRRRVCTGTVPRAQEGARASCVPARPVDEAGRGVRARGAGCGAVSARRRTVPSLGSLVLAARCTLSSCRAATLSFFSVSRARRLPLILRDTLERPSPPLRPPPRIVRRLQPEPGRRLLRARPLPRSLLACSMSRRDESSRRYLNRLDAQTALRHLDTAAHEVGRAGERAGDLARRELKHGWNTVDRQMEDSTLAGSGPGGSPFAFTEVRRLLSLSPTLLPAPKRRAS